MVFIRAVPLEVEATTLFLVSFVSEMPDKACAIEGRRNGAQVETRRRVQRGTHQFRQRDMHIVTKDAVFVVWFTVARLWQMVFSRLVKRRWVVKSTAPPVRCSGGAPSAAVQVERGTSRGHFHFSVEREARDRDESSSSRTRTL